ncbi:MAG: tetratricopeptide repeat protein [Deltaproteobacteria bacterium]|nr:tetratricopeptide repeat protein [Deltaproteobacteria bacterium]
MDQQYLKEREEFLSTSYDRIERGEYETAVAGAKKRITRLPGDLDAWLVIAACWVRMNKFAEAAMILKKLERIVPGWFHVSECLGDLYRRQGMAEEALFHYRQALAPDQSVSWRLRNKMRLLGDTSAAEVPDDAQRRTSSFQTVTIAELYMRQGHFETARNILRTIIEKNREDREARERLKYVEAVLSGKKEAVLIRELTGWLAALQKMKREMPEGPFPL